MFGGLGLGPFKKEKPFQTFQGYGGGAGGAGMAGAGQSPITATGGTKMTDGDYTFHVWGSNAPGSQAFSVSDGGPWNIDILVCGGGGGGAGKGGGGGGGGAVIHLMEYEIDGAPVGTYPITRGQSGTGGPTNQGGTGGQTSVFGNSTPTPLSAVGGGGGGGSSDNGDPGGSGGGGGRGDSNKIAGEADGAGQASNPPNYTSPPAGWGQDGATGWYQGPHNNPAPNGGGGGGGTGGRTNDVHHGTFGFSTIPWLPANLPGAGTYGYPNPGPHPQGYRGGAFKMFGAGGAGGGYDSQNGGGPGDGGGSGGYQTGSPGQNYSGGGGGGGNGGGEGGGTQSPGGPGGNGCVIIRYKTSA